MGKRKNRILFYSSLGLGIFIIILVLAYFLIQSSFFLNFVRKTIITQVNKQINGSIEIASLEGNIFNNLILEDIILSEHNLDASKTELISLKEIAISYDLGSLLDKKIIIKAISLSDLKVNLHQDELGIWNITNIPIKKETTKSDPSSSSWLIELESFSLSNSHVNISGDNLPEQIPSEISITQILAQASLGEVLEWKLSKAELAVEPQEITLSLKDLQGNDQQDISLKELLISSPKSQIILRGDMINQPSRIANLSFKAEPLSFSEIQKWLPSFPLQGEPNLSGEVLVHGDSLSSYITVNLADEQVILNAQLPDLQNPFTALLDLSWENINSNSWKSDLPQSKLTGNLIASIQGDSWPEVEADLSLQLDKSSFNTYKIYTFRLDSKGSPAQLNNSLQAESEFGEINVTADLVNLLDEVGYAISGSFRDLDILKIIPTWPYQAKINTQFDLKGKGLDPKEINSDFNFNFASSSFANKTIEKLKLTGNYQQGNYNLNEMELDYDGLEITAQGQGNIYGDHNISYNLQLNSLPQFVQELQADLALKGRISGRASGSVEDLIASTTIDLQDIKYQDYQLASLIGNSVVKLKDKIPEVDFTGSLTKIELPNLPIDSTWIDVKYTQDKLFLDLNLIQSDTLDIGLRGDVFPIQKLANFSKLEINALGQNWYNRPDTLKVNFDPNQFSLENLELVSDTQTIIANFTLDSQESYDILVKCDSLALWPLSYLNSDLATIKGKLSLNIAGKGDIKNPKLSLAWRLDNLSLKEIEIKKITGNVDYQDNLAQLDLKVNRAKEESISLTGFLPFHADISTKEFKFLKDEQLNLNLKISPIDLNELNDYTDAVKDVKGNFNLSATLENTFNKPLINAKLLVEDVAFKLPSLGIDYRNINLDFQAHNNKLELKKFSLPSGKKGYLQANASTILNLKDARLDSLRFFLEAKNWQAMKNSDMDLMLDSKIEIAGNSTNPTFSGYLNVLRAKLYLPALLGKEKKKVILSTPLLLANSPSSDLPENTEAKLEKKPSQLMKNLRGRLKLSFPHNTWIKSKEMNVELGGELEIIKNSPDFTLSGNVMVLRGNYTVYGRRFIITKGNVYFQGESDMNPEISIIADYILRSSSQEKVTLSIHITGRLQQPLIQFFLDDEPISEGDGVSYIVFGKSTAELSSGERSQMDSSGEDNLATQILVNQIASRVTSLLQNRLNLDVIEFKSDANWRQAQVLVGKYLTNDLFLSYERELSFGSDNEVIPEKITLEYEIIPQLYLQGTQGGENATGVDLIWKFSK